MSFGSSAWPLRALDEICDGRSLVDPHKEPDRRIRYIDISSISNKTFEVTTCTEYVGAEAPSRARQKVRGGDVLFATTRPYLRNVAAIPEALGGALCSTGFCVLRAGENVLPGWLFYLALSDEFMAAVVPKMRGANYPAVSNADVLSVKVPVPPLTEQRRIVDRIRQIIERVDEAQRLRSENESSAQLLLPALLRQEFEGLDATCPMVRLEQVTDESRYGTSEKCHSSGTGTPVLRIPNVADRRCNVEDLKFLPRRVDPADSLLLRAGDLLIVRTNGSPALVGRCAVVPALAHAYAYASYLIRFRLDDRRARPQYVSYFLSSADGRDQISRLRRTSAGQYNINSESLRSIVMPLPPVDQQDVMVERMDRIDNSVRELQERLASAKLQASLVQAAVLRRAFVGEL